MEKLKMHTPDFTDANIAKLAELFPNCVTEARDGEDNVTRSIDFDQLRQDYRRISWKALKNAISLIGRARKKPY